MKVEIIVVFAIFVAVCFPAVSQSLSQEQQKYETERTNAYASQLEKYLTNILTSQYDSRAASAWHRDYSNIDAFERSVLPNRERWAKLVVKPPVLVKSGSLAEKPYTIEGIAGKWLELPLGGITAQAFLAFPSEGNTSPKFPLVIVQHGIGSTPESPFRDGAYHKYAKELLKAGYAVLVPMNLTSIERRNRIERLCRLADISLPGIELVRLQSLLDSVLQNERIDPQRVGMWGVSLGGMATMFWMPLEPRIRAGVVSAWFNHRRNKMAVPDGRYLCFLETNEDHAFFTGWLTEFSDHDVVSLICPRPLMIQHGRQDGIAHWPQVVQEFDRAMEHYKKLNISERLEMDLHDGAHEARIESGIKFLNKWLKH